MNKMLLPEGFITACKIAKEAGIYMIDKTRVKWKKIKKINLFILM